jgi:hypothetical protein
MTSPQVSVNGTYYRLVKFNYTTVNNIANVLRVRVGVIVETHGDYGGLQGAIFLYIKGTLVLQENMTAWEMGKATYYTGWATLTNMADLYNYTTSYAAMNLQQNDSSRLYEIWFEVETGAPIPSSPATGVALNGTLNLSGNSVADVMIGDMVVADVARNISSPFAVIDNLLRTYRNDTTLIQVGTLPDTYQFNGAITEYKKASEWLDYLAFQCRSYFRRHNGVSRLIVRDINPVPTGTISACVLTAEGIKDLSFKKCPRTDVINKVEVFFNRDWTAAGKQADAYKNSVGQSNQASIDIFDVQERPDMFLFDFVTSGPMANDLAAFYPQFYGDRKWRISFKTFLDQSKWGFGDISNLTFLPYATAMIAQFVEAGACPAGIDAMDMIRFIVEAAIIPVIPDNAVTTLLGEPLTYKDGEVVTYV